MRKADTAFPPAPNDHRCLRKVPRQRLPTEAAIERAHIASIIAIRIRISASTICLRRVLSSSSCAMRC